MLTNRPGVICPFASWASYFIYSARSQAQLIREAERFGRRLIHGGSMPLYSHVFCLPCDLHNDIDGLAQIFKAVVATAAQQGKNPEATYARILSRHWRLKLCGQSFFAIAMSCCYSPTHPRFIPSGSQIIFQPEGQFTYFKITTNAHRSSHTKLAKEEFTKYGRRFFDHHANGTPKSLRFVLAENGQGVEWWTSKSMSKDGQPSGC